VDRAHNWTSSHPILPLISLFESVAKPNQMLENIRATTCMGFGVEADSPWSGTEVE